MSELHHLDGIFMAESPAPLQKRLEEGDPREFGRRIRERRQAPRGQEMDALPPDLFRRSVGRCYQPQEGEGAVDWRVVVLRTEGRRGDLVTLREEARGDIRQ